MSHNPPIPATPAPMPDRPRLLNGTTTYGLFGVPGLRHPKELPVMWLTILGTFVCYGLWLAALVWLGTSTATTGLEAQVRVGASPRGGIALMKVAQAIALQEGRTYVIPDDVRLLRHSVLRHRLVLTYDALADGVAPEAIIDAIFAAVPTP